MKIALVAHTDAVWTRHYARQLLGRGHEVVVLSFCPNPVEGVNVVPLGRRRRFDLPGPLWFLARVPRVRSLLRAFAPDVVLATYLSSNGMTAALAWKGPLVVSARGGDVLKQAGYLPAGRLNGSMVRFVCRRAQFVHAVSEELAETLTKHGVPASKIACFPTGVDTEFFTPPATGPSPDGAHVICTRRQEPVYGNETLLDALALLRDSGTAFTCTLVGGGPDLEARRSQVESLDLKSSVSFAGEVGHDQLKALLQSAQIYVSASFSDGTSSSLLEAMACGLFPVLSRIRANERWVREGVTGLFFDPGDPVSLCHALARALGDGALRTGAAPVNRNLVVSEGGLSSNMDRLEALLRRAAEGGPPGR